MNKAKPEDVIMKPVGVRITRILIDYAQKLPGHWLASCLSRSLLGIHEIWKLIYNGNFWVGLQRNSIRGDFWA